MKRRKKSMKKKLCELRRKLKKKSETIENELAP